MVLMLQDTTGQSRGEGQGRTKRTVVCVDWCCCYTTPLARAREPRKREESGGADATGYRWPEPESQGRGGESSGADATGHSWPEPERGPGKGEESGVISML